MKKKGNIRIGNPNKYWVYILLSQRDGGVFIGHTDDVEKALEEHSQGKKRDTKYRLPVVLIHKELVGSFRQVQMREQYWYGAKGRKVIESWIGPLPKPKTKS